MCAPMTPNGMSLDNGPNAGDWENALRETRQSPPPWLAKSVAEFAPTQRSLSVIRPIRAAAFGGTLVFAALLAFLFQHSPTGQSVLVTAAIYGLPLCLAAWLVTSRAQKRLNRKKNRIEQHLYGAGLHLDDDGRVRTDDPHPVLIFDPAIRGVANRR